MNVIEKEDMNKLHNLSNPYQGDAKKVLSVCSAGLLRSPTIANVLQEEFGYNTRSCGIDSRYALVPISHALIHWADEIVCVEQWMKYEVINIIENVYDGRGFGGYTSDKEIIVLGISDSYAYMEDTLQELIIKKYKENKTMSALQHKIAKDLNIKD